MGNKTNIRNCTKFIFKIWNWHWWIHISIKTSLRKKIYTWNICTQHHNYLKSINIIYSIGIAQISRIFNIWKILFKKIWCMIETVCKILLCNFIYFLNNKVNILMTSFETFTSKNFFSFHPFKFRNFRNCSELA